MSETADLDAMADRLAATFGLTIPDDGRARLRMHLDISLGLAAKVMATPLPDETVENAPIFTPKPRNGDPV